MKVFVTGGSGYIGQATIAAPGSDAMSFAKIYFAAGHFEERQGRLSAARCNARRALLSDEHDRVPPDDFFQAMIELPAARYPHSVSFPGLDVRR